eukprot:SAG31_NODE_373_length_16597_cov_21.519518_13_plen_171_part_00
MHLAWIGLAFVLTALPRVSEAAVGKRTELHHLARSGNEHALHSALRQMAQVDDSRVGKTGRSKKQNFNFKPSASAVNGRDDGGATPLHLAAWKGNEAAVMALISHGAEVNAQDRSGWTPLHWAAFKGRAGAAAALLRSGADEKVTDKSGINWLQAGAVLRNIYITLNRLI